MGITVAGKERNLEKEHAGGPDCRAPPEPGEDVFADKRLDLEKKERTEKNRQGICRHIRTSTLLHYHYPYFVGQP